MIHRKSSISTTKAKDDQTAADGDDADIEPIWCHPQVPATTVITQTKTLSDKWSLQSGYNKKSFGLGA